MTLRKMLTLITATLGAATMSLATASAQAVFVDPPASVTSTAGLTGQQRHIARELPRYGYGNVDVRSLSTGQVAHIYNLLHAGRSSNDTRNLIGGVLRPGLLQRGLNRLNR